MEANNKIFHALIENCHEAILLTDENYLIKYANPLNKELLNYNIEELQNKNWLEMIYEEDRIHIERLFNSIRENKKKSTKLEYRVTDGIGNIKWVQSFVNNLLEEEYLNSIVITYTDITALKDNQKALYDMEFHDHLEGIASRRLFQDRLKYALAQAERNQKMVGVILVDLDLVNGEIKQNLDDQLESEILKETGYRLIQNLRQVDTVSRQGIDEFNIVLSNINNEEDAIIVTKKIFNTLTEPFLLSNNTLLELNPFIGFSIYPVDAQNSGQLTLYADIASSEAKNQNKNIVRISTKASSVIKPKDSIDLKEFIKNFKTESK